MDLNLKREGRIPSRMCKERLAMDRKKPVVSEKKKSKRGVANLLILPSCVFLTGVFTPLRPQPLLLLLLCPTFAQGLAAFSSPTSSLFLRHSGDCDL